MSERPPLQRARRGRVLGGVCLGIADHLGVDVLLIRIAAVALALVSVGGVLLAYLLAWVLIPAQSPIGSPLADDEQSPAAVPSGITGQGPAAVRPLFLATGSPAQSVLAAIDDTMTTVGTRLRDPQTQNKARKAAVDAFAMAAAGSSRWRRDNDPAATQSDPDQ